MNYSVEWVPVALNRLAALWVGAPDRAAVAAAADAIDARLERDPYAESESRTGSVRVTFEPPLGVQITKWTTRTVESPSSGSGAFSNGTDLAALNFSPPLRVSPLPPARAAR